MPNRRKNRRYFHALHYLTKFVLCLVSGMITWRTIGLGSVWCPCLFSAFQRILKREAVMQTTSRSEAELGQVVEVVAANTNIQLVATVG